MTAALFNQSADTACTHLTAEAITQRDYARRDHLVCLSPVASVYLCTPVIKKPIKSILARTFNFRHISDIPHRTNNPTASATLPRARRAIMLLCCR